MIIFSLLIFLSIVLIILDCSSFLGLWFLLRRMVMLLLPVAVADFDPTVIFALNYCPLFLPAGKTLTRALYMVVLRISYLYS